MSPEPQRLAAWLRAQLDEIELSDWHERGCQTHQKMPPGSPLGLAGAPMSCLCPVPEFVLEDVRAKRRIIDVVFRYEAKIDGEWGCCHSAAQIEAGLCPDIPADEIPILRLLALPFSSRPGYLEEWRPEVDV